MYNSYNSGKKYYSHSYWKVIDLMSKKINHENSYKFYLWKKRVDVLFPITLNSGIKRTEKSISDTEERKIWLTNLNNRDRYKNWEEFRDTLNYTMTRI